MKNVRFFAILFSLCLILVLAPSPKAAAEAVRVSSVQELVDAIVPGAEIALEPGTYDLTAWLQQGGRVENPASCLSLEECFDGVEAVIYNLDGLRLYGLSDNCADTTLVVKPRYADVLRFEGCSNIRLENLTLGHTPEEGSCVGDVLEFQDCDRVVLTNLDLYGCGTYGVSSEYCSDLRVERCTIRDCSYGILYTVGCTGLRFVDCELRDCRGFNMLDVSGSSVSFDNCRFTGNLGDWSFLTEVETNSIRFYECEFGVWESMDLAPWRSNSRTVSFDERCRFAEVNDALDGPVHVSSPEELFSAIQPDAVIFLEPGMYNLTEWIERTWTEEGESWNMRHPYVRLQPCYDGVEAAIVGANGLSLFGTGENRGVTELVVTPRYADVFSFENCVNVTISGLTLGHTDSGECAGSVLAFSSCSSVTLTNLDLYGCGVYGINGFELGDLTMRGCCIHDCSNGPVYLYGGAGINSFEDCVFTDSDGGFLFYDSGLAVFRRCVFGPVEAHSLNALPDVAIEKCTA